MPRPVLRVVAAAWPRLMSCIVARCPMRTRDGVARRPMRPRSGLLLPAHGLTRTCAHRGRKGGDLRLQAEELVPKSGLPQCYSLHIPRPLVLDHLDLLLLGQHLDLDRLHEALRPLHVGRQRGRQLISLRREGQLHLLLVHAQLLLLQKLLHQVVHRHLVRRVDVLARLLTLLQPSDVHLLAVAHRLLDLRHRPHVLVLHLRDNGSLLVDQHRVVRRIGCKFGILLQERVRVRLDLLLELAPEFLRLLRLLPRDLSRDCRGPGEPVAHASCAKVPRPDDANLGSRCKLGRDALDLARLVAPVLAKHLQLLLNLLLHRQLDAQRELQ